MRNTVALLAGGAAAGAIYALLPMLGFGSTETRVLTFVVGVIVWFSIKRL